MLLQELQTKVEKKRIPSCKSSRIRFCSRSADGLRIQIMDAENRPMFDLGSARLQPCFEDILLILAETIKAVPNKISVSGHTDAKPFAGQAEFGNWELSANRANAARRCWLPAAIRMSAWRGWWGMPRRHCLIAMTRSIRSTGASILLS